MFPGFRRSRRLLSVAHGIDRLGVTDNDPGLSFDLDGVLTQTAKVHAAAWKEMFDAFLIYFATKKS